MPQLKTGIWVDALIRRAQVAGAYACVVMRGDRDAGSVLVTVRSRAVLSLFTPERDMQGERVWREDRLDEAALYARIAARRDFDPDLMVVEIEDRDGRHFIDEGVIRRDSGPASPDPADATQADAAAHAAAVKALFRDR